MQRVLALPLALGLLSHAPALAQGGTTQCGTTLLPPGGAPDSYGIDVAHDGDVAVVGARWEGSSGSAHVFERSSQGWLFVQTLEPSAAPLGATFGRSVTVSGDRIVVGAPGPSGEGAAYVFTRQGGAWSETAILTGSGGSFGHSVAMDQSLVVVGEYGARTAFAFDLDQPAVPGVELDPGGSFHRYGIRVDLRGDTIVVGADGASIAASEAGAAFVFRRSASSWAFEAQLLASDADAGDGFGNSVAVDAGRIVVGASSDDESGAGAGAAYVFGHSSGGWTQQEKLMVPGAGAGAGLGRHSLDLRGDLLLVGAWRAGPGLQGASYLFEDSAAGWSLAATFEAPDSIEFGWSNSLGERDVLIGANGETSGPPLVVVHPLENQTTYCPGAVNSTGAGAQLTASGGTSISANTTVLEASSCPPGQPGLCFYGYGRVAVPFAGGTLCVSPFAPGLFRLSPVHADGAGVATCPLDFSSAPMGAGAGAGQIQAGSTWGFQFWYRDPVAPLGGGSNLSSALELTFCY